MTVRIRNRDSFAIMHTALVILSRNQDAGIRVTNLTEKIGTTNPELLKHMKRLVSFGLVSEVKTQRGTERINRIFKITPLGLKELDHLTRSKLAEISSGYNKDIADDLTGENEVVRYVLASLSQRNPRTGIAYAPDGLSYAERKNVTQAWKQANRLNEINKKQNLDELDIGREQIVNFAKNIVCGDSPEDAFKTCILNQYAQLGLDKPASMERLLGKIIWY
jgi:DNA-binding MarR family transcriptional regulator